MRATETGIEMAYIVHELAEGERLIKLSRPSWWSVVARTVLSIAVLAVVIVVFTMGAWLTALVLWVIIVPLALAAWIAMVAPLIVRIWSTEIAITDRRVTSKSGVFKVEVKTTPLDKVNNVNVTQSVLGRMLNYGDIEVTTATADSTDNHFVKTLAHPNDFRNALSGLTTGG